MMKVQVAVADPIDVIDAAEAYGGITVHRGPPGSVVLEGEYDELMEFMTEELAMTDAEADIAIGGEGDEPRAFHEGVSFDRFMDAILIAEGGSRGLRSTGDSPLRRRAALHQDRPGNRTRFAAGRHRVAV